MKKETCCPPLEQVEARARARRVLPVPGGLEGGREGGWRV